MRQGQSVHQVPWAWAVFFRELTLFLSDTGGHQRALNKQHGIICSVVDAISATPSAPHNLMPSFSHLLPSFSGKLPLALQKAPCPGPCPFQPPPLPHPSTLVKVWLAQHGENYKRPSLCFKVRQMGGATLILSSSEIWPKASPAETSSFPATAWFGYAPSPKGTPPKNHGHWNISPRLRLQRTHPRQHCDPSPS